MSAHRVQLGDCLELLPAIDTGSADLVYLDPPYNTGSERIGTERGKGASRYPDRWPDVRAYLAFMRPRLEQIHRVLRASGSILLHCDWRTSHHLRLLLDDVFGADRFVNHLVWSYGLGGSSPRRFARKHDDILFYARGANHYFLPPRVPATSARLRGQSKKATDVLAIPSINNMAAERTGYPTQKPVALLRLLVEACCPPGGLVIDPFCGSGTTLAAAIETGRRALGMDINPDALRIATERLAMTGELRH
ncbi:MAG: site-specific DNA-methyltransferase [Phycisphaerales bacterium]|nr:site-specific DNA-methyltransferase [Phycisphaerales bacterium]